MLIKACNRAGIRIWKFFAEGQHHQILRIMYFMLRNMISYHSINRHRGIIVLERGMKTRGNVGVNKLDTI